MGKWSNTLTGEALEERALVWDLAIWQNKCKPPMIPLNIVHWGPLACWSLLSKCDISHFVLTLECGHPALSIRSIFPPSKHEGINVDGSSFDNGNCSLPKNVSTKTCWNLPRHGLFGKKQTGHRFQVAVSPLELWALIVLWKNQVKEKAANESFSFTVLLS